MVDFNIYQHSIPSFIPSFTVFNQSHSHLFSAHLISKQCPVCLLLQIMLLLLCALLLNESKGNITVLQLVGDLQLNVSHAHTFRPQASFHI